MTCYHNSEAIYCTVDRIDDEDIYIYIYIYIYGFRDGESIMREMDDSSQYM